MIVPQEKRGSRKRVWFLAFLGLQIELDFVPTSENGQPATAGFDLMIGDQIEFFCRPEMQGLKIFESSVQEFRWMKLRTVK